MSDEDKTPRPPIPFIADGSQDAAVIVALNEQYRRRQQAANMSSMVDPPHVPAPPPPPVFVYDGSQDAAMIAAWEAHRRQAFIAATTGSTGPVPVPEDEFPVLVSQAVIIPYGATHEGLLIRAATLPLLAIIKKIMEDPTLMYQFDPWKWEEIVVASYQASGLFDEVTLTPRSGDRGKDLVAVKKGVGALRIVESVKRRTPGTKHRVTAEEVQALLGVVLSDPQASKGVISTTWEFAPKINENPHITQYIPYRLDLVDGKKLLERFKEYTTTKSK
jgi:restriction system protein